MHEILIKVGELSVYTLSFAVVVGYFWYGFVIYKKGLEYRYSPESLLDLTVLSGVFGWICSRVFYAVFHLGIFQTNWLRIFLLMEYPGYDYVGLLVGLYLGVLLLAKRGEIKMRDGFDLVGLGLPGAIALERLGRVLSGQGTLVFNLPVEIFQAFLFLLMFVWLWRVEGEYRTYEWYRFRKTQAKSGFILGSYLFLSGLVFVISNIWPTINVSMVVLGAVSIVSGVVTIYVQSGRSVAHDVKLLPFVKRWYTNSK